MTLRVAIVGCGKIADGHAGEILGLRSRARLVAACDREPALAEQLCRRFGVPGVYDDVADMLARERPEVVHITAPPQAHLGLALQSLAAGAHVVVEKPFALSRAEGERLLAEADARGRLVTIGYGSFFDPPALRMRALVAAGAIGEPLHVESLYGYNLGSDFGQAALGDPDHWVRRLPGRLLHNVLDHALNKIAEFLPDDAPEILARGRALRPGADGDRFPDELRAMLVGRRVTAYLTFSSHVRPTQQLVRVYGTRGTLQVDYEGRSVTCEPTPRLPSALGRLQLAFSRTAADLREGLINLADFARAEFRYFAGLRELLRRFYDAILGGGPPPYPYRDILRIAGWMDHMFASLAEPDAP